MLPLRDKANKHKKNDVRLVNMLQLNGFSGQLHNNEAAFSV